MAEHKLTRDTDDHEFPSNSNKKKERIDAVKEKNITQVVSGKVIKKQRTFGQKLAETFFGDDARSVGDYLLNDILVPAMKSTLSDMVGGGIEMLLFGERKSSTRGRLFRDRDRSYVPYNRMSRRDDVDDRRYISKAARSRHDFDEIILETRGEAEDVLSHVVDIIDDYGVASVADYYDLLGVEGNFTDNKYGWTNVSDAYITRTRDGYSIRLPRPREIWYAKIHS